MKPGQTIFVIDLSKLHDYDLDVLNLIGTAIGCEQRNRIVTGIKNGDYEPINQSEMDLVDRGEKVRAIVAYRDRTQVNILVAKEIIDPCLYTK